jgi:hypothetical protein
MGYGLQTGANLDFLANDSLMRGSRCLQKQGLRSDRYTQANKSFQLLSSLRG